MSGEGLHPPEIEPKDLISETDVVATHITRNEARLVKTLQRVIETEAFRCDGYSSPTAGQSCTRSGWVT